MSRIVIYLLALSLAINAQGSHGRGKRSARLRGECLITEIFMATTEEHGSSVLLSQKMTFPLPLEQLIIHFLLLTRNNARFVSDCGH